MSAYRDRFWIIVLAVVAAIAIHAIILYSALSHVNVPALIAGALIILLVAFHRRLFGRHR